MKAIFLIFISILTIQTFAQQVAKRPVDFSYLQADMYEDFSEPVVVVDSAHIFAQPDSTSPVLRTTYLAEHVNLIAYGRRESFSHDTMIDKVSGVKNIRENYYLEDWYRVDLGQSVGYISASAMATHSFSGAKDYTYFIQASYTYLPQHAWGSMIYKYDNEKHRVTDTMFLEAQNLRKVSHITSDWHGVNVLFSATSIFAYCGGGTSTYLIADVNGKLTKLIRTGTAFQELTADGEETKLWLPVRFGKTKVMHLINGDTHQVFDEYAGTLITYTIPADIQFPKSEITVLERTIHKGFTNKAGEPIQNPDGSYKETVRKIYEYYHWTGSKLQRIK